MPQNSPSPRLWPWLGIAVVIVLLDQFTKMLITGHYELGQSTYMTSFFNIVRVHNTGAAFSFLAGAGGWQRWFFVTLAIGVSGFIVWMLRTQGHQKLFAWALTLIGAAMSSQWLRRALSSNASRRARASFSVRAQGQENAELNRSREQLRLALESIDAGISETNLQTGERFFSPRFSEILGYADRDVFGMSVPKPPLPDPT